MDKGHGRVDTRRIETLSILPSSIDFPGAKQIGRIERQRTIKGEIAVETVYFITSLPRLRANAAALLKLSRAHWSIENKVHRVRDVTFGEDACTVTSGNAPQVLAALRNALVTLLGQYTFPNLARAHRRFAARPLSAINLLRGLCSDF